MKVLYIAGYGRSGSTLLDQLLGQFDTVVSTGELEKIWQYGIVDNKYCSCGQLFYDCEFWKAVVTDAYGDDYVDVANKALELRKHIKFRDMFVFTNSKTSILKGDAYTEYLKIWGRLLNSIAKVGKSTLIVDSSKVPTFIHLMERSSEINLYVLNLVRDSRGVAFSYERKKTTREKDGLEIYLSL